MKAITFIAALAAAGSAHALEPFASYDNFSSKPIDPARWTSGERVLTIKGRALNLMQRTWGLDSSDAGLTFVNFNEYLTNPSAVTALKAKITVNALEVNACPANTSVAQSRARIIGSFFNVGTATPTSQTGDFLAQVKIGRFSNSIDAPGVLRVQGTLVLCNNSDCSSSSTVSTVELGTVTLGQAAVVQMQWDRAGKTFLFDRDNGAFSGSAGYTFSDTSAPGVPTMNLSTRLDLPACASAPRVAGSVDALFDNIAVNQSAAP